MLFLADIPPDDRYEAFDAECYKRALAPTTAHAYWCAWMSALPIMRLEPQPFDAKFSRTLKARAARYPVRFPPPLLATHTRCIFRNFRSLHPDAVTMILVAWTLGQRISDMMQVATSIVSSRERRRQSRPSW